jgi:predicted CopG family antitoxin
MNELTKQIKVQDDTYKELTELGKKNETFDDIIKKCVKAYKEKTSRKYEPRG